MPITLNCPKCHKPFRVRDESIGGRVRCPSCGSVLQVPAALSPASNFDEIPKSESASQVVRPVAEEVQGSHGGSLYDIVAGGPVQQTRSPDSAAAAGAPMPGPPSIKMQGAQQPPPVQPPQVERPSRAVPLPTAPSPDRARQPATPGRPFSDEELTWAKVAGGLGMIRLAMYLLALIFLAIFGQAIWIAFDYDRAWSDDPGLLKRADWPLKKEVFTAYTVGFGVPAALLLLIGRLRCGGAPPESHARGLATGAAFFTLIAIAGGALYLALTYFNVPADKIKLPPQARLTAVYAAIPSIALADVLTMLFIGQIGWPLRRPQLQKSVAGFFVFAAILPAAVLIGLQYYPPDFVAGGLGTEDDTARRNMIWGVILLSACVLFFLRYAGVASKGRRAIRKKIAGES